MVVKKIKKLRNKEMRDKRMIKFDDYKKCLLDGAVIAPDKITSYPYGYKGKTALV